MLELPPLELELPWNRTWDTVELPWNRTWDMVDGAPLELGLVAPDGKSLVAPSGIPKKAGTTKEVNGKDVL